MRTQSTVAVSADGHGWVLVNASPDLRTQLIESQWRPHPHSRGTPIEAILLTDADLDHTLGLFLLREDESPLFIHASTGIKEAVEQGLRLTEVLGQYCGVHWVTAPSAFEPLLCRDRAESGLEYKAVEIEGPGPRYRSGNNSHCRLFYVMRESATGKTALLAPAVGKLEAQLVEELCHADAILFDGTFWANDDFDRSGVSSPAVSELLRSHLPILHGSLNTLAAQRAKHKFYVHINNTNPILWDDSPERRLLEKMGIEVAKDGMRIEL